MSENELRHLDGSHGRVERRAVLGAAVWAAPAIVAATAAPAFAASTPQQQLAAVWVNDSFRTTSTGNLGTGTPAYSNGAQFGAIAIKVTAVGVSLSGLRCDVAVNGNGVAYNNSAATRGATSWSANNADLAANGWSASPAVTSTAASTSFVFQRGAQLLADVPIYLKLVVDQIANADLSNATFTFSATGVPNVVVTSATSTTVSPYLSGSPNAAS